MTHATINADNELSEYFHTAHYDLYDEWVDRLRCTWGDSAATKLSYIQTNRKSGSDLFSILLESLKKDSEILDLNIEPLYKKVRSPDYSVSDYYTEASCLRQCLERYLTSLNGWTERRLADSIIAVNQCLDQITMRILKECFEFLEHIAEASITALCQKDLDGRIVFASREMNRLTREETLIGHDLSQYFEKEDKKIVSDTILNRNQLQPAILRLNLIALDGKRTPVGSEIGPLVINGQYKGGYAHFTDISKVDLQYNQLFDRALLGTVAKRMHDHIESRHQDETVMLEKVATELSLVVNYDCITVTKYSDDLRSASPIFSNNAGRGHTWQRRWWKLTPAQIKWANQKEILLVEDLEAFLDQQGWIDIKNEPDVQKIMADGFKSFIFYPIFRDRRLVASISLLNKSSRRFKEHHIQLLGNLPIDAAVHMALYYHNRRESSFISDLTHNLANAGSDVDSIAAIIVNSVAAHYNWDSVSLYKVNPIRKVVQLLEQTASDDKYLLDKNYEQMKMIRLKMFIAMPLNPSI